MSLACVGLGFGVPVGVVDVRVVGVAVEVVLTDVGRGSLLLTSTQYEFPICIPLQSALMLRFLCRNQYRFVRS
jgi:hypothetical protein